MFVRTLRGEVRRVVGASVGALRVSGTSGVGAATAGCVGATAGEADSGVAWRSRSNPGFATVRVLRYISTTLPMHVPKGRKVHRAPRSRAASRSWYLSFSAGCQWARTGPRGENSYGMPFRDCASGIFLSSVVGDGAGRAAGGFAIFRPTRACCG